MENFICIAQFVSKSGKENDLLKALLSLLEPTRAEQGCISYELHQNVQQPSLFTMVEFFKSQEDFDFHSKQSYLTDFREAAKDFIESRKLTFGTTLNSNP